MTNFPRPRGVPTTTTVARICVGFDGVHVCTSDGTGGRVFAVEEWEWTGADFTRSHGVCEACFTVWNAQQDALEVA